MLPIIVSSFNRGNHVRSVLVRSFDPVTCGFNESAACLDAGSLQSPANGCHQTKLVSRPSKFSKPVKTVRLAYRFETEHYALWLFIDTLNRSDEFARSFVRHFAHLKYDRLRIKYNLTDTPVYPLLKSWNQRIVRLYYQKMHLEVCFSWLSTLGGACATLGDKYKNFAHKAALISSDQLKLGLMLSDPYTICRTLIYNVYSLIQRDQFSCAFKLLKRVVHPYIRKHFGFKRQTEEYFILKGMYTSARDNYHFKRNHLKKRSTACANGQLNGLTSRPLNGSVPIVVS